jgi:hypothetical protein
VSAKLRQAKQLRPRFSDEALPLFRALENVPPSMRRSDEFRTQDFALHDALGLGFERRFRVCSVLDRSDAPC